MRSKLHEAIQLQVAKILVEVDNLRYGELQSLQVQTPWRNIIDPETGKKLGGKEQVVRVFAKVKVHLFNEQVVE